MIKHAPFAPPPREQLDPVIAFLQSNRSVSEPESFPRGTALPDGRLDLCKQSIGPEGLRAMSAALRRNRQISSLLLGTNGIGDVGANEVADLIRDNEQLQTVYLGCNYITNEGCQPLARALRNNTSVRALWLKRNPIGAKGAFKLAEMLAENSHLRTLDLVHTQIGHEGLKAILDALIQPGSAIEYLFLGGNNFAATEARLISDHLQTNGRLKGVFLGSSHLGDDGAQILAEAFSSRSDIRHLGLASNGIGPKGARSFCRSLPDSRLLGLDLGYSPSTNVLGVSPNHIGDAGAIALAKFLECNPPMESIKLIRNKITAVGAQRLSESIEHNESIRELKLGKGIPWFHKARISERLEKNRKRGTTTRDCPDIDAIQSVYRIFG